MRAHKSFRKQLQRAFSLLLVLTLLLPAGNALAYEGGSSPAAPEEKIEADLQEALKQGGKVSFIVSLKDKADPALLAERAVMMDDGSMTEDELEAVVRGQVVLGLQAQAEETQTDLISYLDQAVRAGEVERYKSFYITNAVSVVGTAAAAEAIAAFPEVESIVLDEIIAPPVVEVEPELYSEMNEGDGPLTPWNLTSISQDKVRDEMHLDGTGVVVGIIDTGVDGSHPALAEGWRGNDPELAQYSWLDLDYEHESKTPVDYRGHGTHVCGTIMGREDNNGNYLGVAPGAQWIAARVFDDEGASQEKLIEAGQWMLAPLDEDEVPHPEMAPDIVNNSWGGNTEDEVFYKDILEAWLAAGIVPVFAAGNASSSNPGGAGSIQIPASFPEAFAVGALKKNDGLAKFSLRGPSDYADFKPDVSAPGVSIRSSMPGGGYGLMSGTSMACPHVAGAFALLKQADPEATVEEMEAAMRDTCTPLTDAEYVNTPNNGYGYGKINVYNAVKKLQDTESTAFGTFSGHIYEAGEDADTPVIQHAPIKQMFSSGINTPVEAKVSDAGGISRVTLRYAVQDTEDWTEKEMDLTAGTKRDGTFLAEIGRQELNEAGMQYQIIAEDNAGKTTETEIFKSAVASGITIGYNQDFEENTDGIEFGGKTPMWQWGVPTSGPMAAKSGEKCVATNLSGNYDGLIDAIFVLPVIDLTEEKTGGRKATLSFNHWFDMGNYQFAEYETAEVWIAEAPDSDAELDYKMVRQYKNSNDNWDTEYIDLTPYDGKKIYVMFGVRGNLHAPQLNDGWYIDDIKIEEAVDEAPDAPSPKKIYKPNGVVQLRASQLADPRVSSYRLYRSASPEGPFDQVAEVFKKSLGEYSSVNLLDTPLPQVGTYYYYMTALIGENESVPSKILSHTFTEGEDAVVYDFESDNGGWTTESGEGQTAWTYGEYQVPEGVMPEHMVGSKPSESACKSKNPGNKLWATEMDTFRTPNTKYTLVSDTIDLSEVENGTLYFQNWFNTQGRRGLDDYGTQDNDRCYVYFSKDNGESWDIQLTVDDDLLYEAGEQNQHRAVDTWYTEFIQIPAEYQVPTFKLKFELEARSDTSGSGCGGWYLDDVRITSNPGASAVTKAEKTASAEAFVPVNMMAMDQEVRVYGELDQETGYLPVDGTITIPETGSKYYAEVGTGIFQFTHPVGTFTAVAECRGYQSETFSVTIGAEEPAVHDFVLTPAARNSVTLKVADGDGAPLADAVAFLTGPEDTFRVKADESGEITIPGVYAGTYLLNLSAAGHETKDQTVTVMEGQALNLGTVTLNAIAVQEVKELSYDDGQANTYLNSLLAGRVGGIKVENNRPVVLDTLKFMFVTGSVDFVQHSSEGHPFEFAIYEDDGFDGLPGRALVDFTPATAGTDGSWTEVKVPGSVVVNGDFYIAYKQVEDIAEGTLLGVDEDNQGMGRNFLLHNGGWIPADEKGVYMIRADVKPIGEDSGDAGKTIVDVVSSATLPIEVTEGDNVLDTLHNSGIKVRINYSDETSEEMTLTEYLDGAEIKLNGKTVKEETVFVKSSETIVIRKDNQQIAIKVQVTPSSEKPQPQQGAATAKAAGLKVEQFLDLDGNVGFTANLKDPKNIYAMDLTVEGTGDYVSTVGLNGFTVVRNTVKNNGDGTFSGTVYLTYTGSMARAAHQALTQTGLVDAVRFAVTSASEEEPAAMTMNTVHVAGAPDFDSSDMSVVTGGTRTAVYEPLVRYDVDGNGVINLGDLALAVRCYRAAAGDADWNKTQKGDVNRDGVVSIADFVEIALHINA